MNSMSVNGGKTRTNSTVDDPNHTSSKWVLPSTNSNSGGCGGPGIFPPITDNLTLHLQMGTSAILDDKTSNLPTLSSNHKEGVAGTIDEHPISDYFMILDNRDYPVFDPVSVDDELRDLNSTNIKIIAIGIVQLPHHPSWW